MEKILYSRFMLIKDNFYSNPQQVYRHALACEFYEPEHVTGYRSTTVYHEKGIKARLEKILGIKINRWDTDPLEENGVFYQGLSQGKKKEVPGVHADEPYNDITAIVYLTPGIPFNCGTSLWMHKETGLINPAMPADAKRLGIKLADLQMKLERESKDRSKWVEIDRAGYQFNRFVAYPSGAFHSATNHFGGTLQNGRIYQTFRIGVDWRTLRLNA